MLHRQSQSHFQANRVAKQVSLHPPSDTLSLPLQDFYPSIARTIHESWQARWDTSQSAGNKLALIKPTVERWSSSTRLTHGHLMTRSDRPLCLNYPVPLSVVHFLVDCPRYASLRRSLFPISLPTISFSRPCRVPDLKLRHPLRFPDLIRSPN